MPFKKFRDWWRRQRVRKLKQKQLEQKLLEKRMLKLVEVCKDDLLRYRKQLREIFRLSDREVQELLQEIVRGKDPEVLIESITAGKVSDNVYAVFPFDLVALSQKQVREFEAKAITARRKRIELLNKIRKMKGKKPYSEK